MNTAEYNPESKNLLSLSTLISYQSKGLLQNIELNKNNMKWFDLGKKLYFQKIGQMGLSCNQCHDERVGQNLRAERISQGHVNGFPTYLLRWSKIASVHRRIQFCNEQARALPFKIFSDEYNALQLYMTWRGNGLKVETPAVRNNMTIYKDSLDLIGNTPMLLVKSLNTGLCNLYLKLESFNLGGSIKDRPAKNMIVEAEKKGLLKKGGTIVEATAGNTGIALSIIAIKRGYKVIIVVPNKMTVEKIFHLKALGAKVIVTRSDVTNGHPEYYLDLAKKIAKNKNAFYINQFSNKANINSHINNLGPEIYKQLDGKIDAFVAGVGTGGTISGVGYFLKSKNKNCDLVLADPKGSILKDLVKTGNLKKDVGSWIVEGIGEDFCPPLLRPKLIDQAFSISDYEAIKSCRKLLKNEGILSGSSSGTLLAAALKYCKLQKVKKNVVTLICDAGDKYLRKIYNESWRIKEGFNFSKKAKNLKDVVSHLNRSSSIPTINVNSKCSLAFKLMHENGINFLLVETDKKKIIGVITEGSLLEKVSYDSFESTIKNNITKVKKVDYKENYKKVISLIKKYNYLFVYEKDAFYGVINKTDILWYLRKKEINA